MRMCRQPKRLKFLRRQIKNRFPRFVDSILATASLNLGLVAWAEYRLQLQDLINSNLTWSTSKNAQIPFRSRWGDSWGDSGQLVTDGIGIEPDVVLEGGLDVGMAHDGA